jgi:hypothetical protein
MRLRLGNLSRHNVVVDRLRPFRTPSDRLSAFDQTDNRGGNRKFPGAVRNRRPERVAGWLSVARPAGPGR